jgi:hypothetical protein
VATAVEGTAHAWRDARRFAVYHSLTFRSASSIQTAYSLSAHAVGRLSYCIVDVDVDLAIYSFYRYYFCERREVAEPGFKGKQPNSITS